MPTLVDDFGPALADGPVLVTIEYTVGPQQAAEFVAAMHQYERLRRRDGLRVGVSFTTLKSPTAMSRRSSCLHGGSTCANMRVRRKPIASWRNGYTATCAGTPRCSI